MRIKLTMIMLSLLATNGISQGSPGTVADLPAGLRQALAHDSACENTHDLQDRAEAELVKSPIVTQEIRNPAGAEVGVIATPQNDCHCREAKCTTYVYLRSGEYYKLAFSSVFTSLHPMRVFKRGFPSLTGKLQLSESRSETTVYDWNGAKYEPSLCATITQGRGQKRPAIARHECAK